MSSAGVAATGRLLPDARRLPVGFGVRGQLDHQLAVAVRAVVDGALTAWPQPHECVVARGDHHRRDERILDVKAAAMPSVRIPSIRD